MALMTPTTLPRLTHLQRLEAESIHIMREVVAECEKPVMLYSIGKDSAVMLHLAPQGLLPGEAAVPAAPRRHHVEVPRRCTRSATRMARELGLELLVHRTPRRSQLGINPFDHGSAVHTDIWKTEGLKQALDQYGFDAAFGGARRDEEKSRAKERVFSLPLRPAPLGPEEPAARSSGASTTRASSRARAIRVFPLSNWTELDVWQYIHLEDIPIVPLYFAARAPGRRARRHADHGRRRAHAARARRAPDAEDGALPHAGLLPADRRRREHADTLPADHPGDAADHAPRERQGRVIDHDASGSMEKKKQEGYF